MTFAGKVGMNTGSLTNPHKKKFMGVRSGERGGHAIDAALPIHRAGKRVLRCSHPSQFILHCLASVPNAVHASARVAQRPLSSLARTYFTINSSWLQSLAMKGLNRNLLASTHFYFQYDNHHLAQSRLSGSTERMIYNCNFIYIFVVSTWWWPVRGPKHVVPQLSGSTERMIYNCNFYLYFCCKHLMMACKGAETCSAE
jgi:hypothetical protein